MNRGVAPHAVRRRMNKETQMMLVPQGSIEGYIRAANEYPMLTAEEEKSLAKMTGRISFGILSRFPTGVRNRTIRSKAPEERKI